MLCCKTRGNTAPAGKTKIYIIARPEDREQYLDAVVRILLHTVNAAVYYDDGVGEASHLDEQHKEYQLAVAIVTKEFLLTGNSAREQELTFAMNRNIPVFPFTFEPGVDILFDKIVGHYQCIYAGQQTGTEKNFYQKLQDAISTITEPEELHREIYEKAFDLFLFISYRKIDRKYVNEYVNRMHQIPILQGIGYWYDEELVMGTDYNEEIDNALRSSDAVLLIVTPNVLAEGNYVKTIEYQRAVSYGKPIVAVELAPTDRRAFIEAFPEVDYYISLAEEAGSEAVLLNLIKLKQGNPESGSRSRHRDYLLGQAYTYGIGVEVNHALGRKMLTQLAESGYVPAMEAVIDLYENQIGVSAEPETLDAWRKELVQARQYLFTQSRNKETLLAYLDSLYKYGNDFFMRNQLKEAEQVYLQFLKISEEYQIACEDMIKVCFDLGNIYYVIGHYERAKEYLTMQLQLTTQYLELKGEADIKAARSYVTARILLNDAELALENYSTAEKGYLQAEQEAKKNYEAFPCNETLRDLRSVYSRLGRLYTVCAEVYGERQLLQLACKYKTEAAEMGNAIYKELMSTHNLMNLIQDFIDAGDVCYLVQDYSKAKTYYNKATNAFVRLRQNDLANLSDYDVLTVYAPNMDRVYGRLSEICYELGDAQSATACYAMYQQITQVLGTEE